MTRSTVRRRMTTLVQQCHASDEPQRAFATRHGISRAKLRYWVRQLLRPDAAEPIGVTPVRVVADDVATAVLEIALPSGVWSSTGAPRRS
ncbi:MAG TPA: hypothetical protein VKE51_00600 [Vicinamibacterales bacterium]|nr:hypothetical protein [Vicinamibacterales bacterium]